jgi:hypothetical protein
MDQIIFKIFTHLVTEGDVYGDSTLEQWQMLLHPTCGLAQSRAVSRSCISDTFSSRLDARKVGYAFTRRGQRESAERAEKRNSTRGESVSSSDIRQRCSDVQLIVVKRTFRKKERRRGLISISFLFSFLTQLYVSSSLTLIRCPHFSKRSGSISFSISRRLASTLSCTFLHEECIQMSLLSADSSRFERRKKNFIRARHICHVSASYMPLYSFRESAQFISLGIEYHEINYSVILLKLTINCIIRR